MATDSIPEYAKKRVLIIGCGNILFGDDGFGPATVEYIEKNFDIPDDVHVMDAGTGVSRILFTLALSEVKPRKIIILDAMDLKKKPGEIFEMPIEDLPENKSRDFSSHLFPSINLLKEMRDTHGIEVLIIACQVKKVPETVSSGLSEVVKRSVPRAAKIVLELAKRK